MGDLDKDGIADFAFCYYSYRKVYIIYGHTSLGASVSYPISNLNTSPFFGFIITSLSGSPSFGLNILGNFDHNDDGNPDIMVSDVGAAYTVDK
jgi:hypothetical protein